MPHLPPLFLGSIYLCAYQYYACCRYNALHGATLVCSSARARPQVHPLGYDGKRLSTGIKPVRWPSFCWESFRIDNALTGGISKQDTPGINPFRGHWITPLWIVYLEIFCGKDRSVLFSRKLVRFVEIYDVLIPWVKWFRSSSIFLLSGEVFLLDRSFNRQFWILILHCILAQFEWNHVCR